MSTNTHPGGHGGTGPALPPDLAARLRGLREDAAPERDLWPAISARLEPRSAAGDALRAGNAGSNAAATAATQAKCTPMAPLAPAPPAAPRRHPRRHLRRRNAAYATAAAVVLAVAAGWQLLPVRVAVDPSASGPANVVATGAAAGAASPLLQAADALAREYQGALREVEATGTASGTASAAPSGLDAELDRSAAEVRAALARDPDALHLFHRLQHIYAHRLALSLRQA
ncbi:hypothetical protein [Luteimonas changyuni]|uniref:hypothetical protein n=1 Tax=Luteimonas sp. MJ145 TaxID=3129234 RepID=UPI0031BA6AED